MESHGIHDTGYLFADTEVIVLCQSIIDIHRALNSLCQFLGDLEDGVHTTSEALTNDFQRWGIRAVGKKFITDQRAKLNRIMEIYQKESNRLNEKTRNP
jgi:hypothetical protein